MRLRAIVGLTTLLCLSLAVPVKAEALPAVSQYDETEHATWVLPNVQRHTQAQTVVLDFQVAASVDDGTINTPSAYGYTGTAVTSGYSFAVYNSWYRFTGVTIPQGATITAAYVSLYERSSAGNPQTRIYAVKANDPTAISSYADYGARTLTTAYVDANGDPGADGWYNSPSLVTILQELVNAYSYTNQAVEIMHKDNGSAANLNYRNSYAWDWTDHSRAPKLHIEYTAGWSNIQYVATVDQANINSVAAVLGTNIATIIGIAP